MNDDLVFEMPPGIGFAVSGWDPTGEIEHRIDGELSIESKELSDTIRLREYTLDQGDLVIVQTVSSVDVETFQRMFRLDRNEAGDLDAVMTREATLVGMDLSGRKQAIGDAVVFTPHGELTGAGVVAASNGSVVAEVSDEFGEITKQWDVTAGAAGLAQFNLETDVRSYRSTAVADDALRDAAGEVRSAVVIVANEDVVGVVVDTSDDRFVVAVTDAAGEFESFETVHDVEATLSIGADSATLRAGVFEAQRRGLHVAPSLLSADLAPAGTVAMRASGREVMPVNGITAERPNANLDARERNVESRSVELDSFDL